MSGGDALITSGSPVEVFGRGGADVEQQIQRGQARLEGSSPALRVHGVLQLLPLDAHAGTGEGLLVQVMARAAHAAMESRPRAERAADVEQQLGARAFGIHLRRE